MKASLFCTPFMRRLHCIPPPCPQHAVRRGGVYSSLGPLPQACISLHYPIMRSMLDGEEMRQEMERLKESDAITEAIREFGKVGGRRVYACGAMGLPSSASVASFVGPPPGRELQPTRGQQGGKRA